MRPARDTSADAQRVVDEAMSRATPMERLRMASEQTELLWTFVWSGVIRDMPGASDAERRACFLQRWLGAPLADDVIAWLRDRPAAR